MIIRKLITCSGVTLCALAMHTASAQNYQGWANPGQWGYGGGVPQMPYGMPRIPQAAPRMPYGMPHMPYGIPQISQPGPMRRFGAGGLRGQQAAPYRNPWAGMSMPYASDSPGGTSQAGMNGISGMSGMQGQEGVSGMPAMSSMQGQPGMSGMSGMHGQTESFGSPFGQSPWRVEQGPGGVYFYPSR